MPTLKQNEIFANRYQLIKKLGVGGYSEVWLVKDNKTGGMEVALKIYSHEKGLDDKGLETFSKEFSLVFNLNHLNLLKPTYFDDYEGSPYLVMPYCKNASMADKIGNITEKELASFIHQASSALAYLHEQQPPIIHQDIKPDNFLIDNSGHYFLADFGISSKIRKTLTKTMGEKNSSGTMAYMPPEKFSRDRQTIKAGDIFSLGITLYELLTGELAFGEHGGLSLHGGADIPDLPKQYSSELNDLIRSCMAKDPWDRPTAETLMEIAKNYEFTGKWDITKLPKVKQVVPEEPIIIPKDPEKPKAREIVQITVNKPDNEQKLPTTKPQSDSYGKYILFFGIAIAFIISIIYFSINNGPSAEEKAVEEQKIHNSIAKKIEENRINDSIEAAEQDLKDYIAAAGQNISDNNISDENQQNSNSTDNWQANYDKVYAFFFGRAVVMKNGKYGYVDTNGKLVISLQYQDAYDFRKEGLALVKKNGLFGFIDKNGNVVINFYYEKAKSFENGKAHVYGVTWHYIDTKGNIITNQVITFNNNPLEEPIKTLKIGDTYAGGIIFYLDASGQHGKVCAPYDQISSASWDEAVKICNNLALNGYNDWYLPAKNDFELMYRELHVMKIVEFFGNYWSSSAYYFDSAFGFVLSDNIGGYALRFGKDNTLCVRAVRAF